jgi:hypothetical protein
MRSRPRSAARLRHQLLTLGLGSAPLFLIVSPAQADRGRYVARSFTEPANPGLAVNPPLERFRAVSRGRVVVPAEWRRQKANPGQLRFLTPGGHCRYNLTFTIRTQLSPPRDAADYVADALPSPGQGRLLDQGQRGSKAFRVIHAVGTASTVRLDALWAGVLTKRADIAPTGQVAWSEIRVTAASRRGDECHSGTWRDRLGPQLGDALATARTRLRFVPSI